MIVDTHVHVIDPARFPLPVDGGGYIPRLDETATAEELAEVAASFSVTHQVIVQPSGAGTDNSATLDAVRQSPLNRRAIVACGSSVSHAEIERLRAAGAVGLRLNVVTLGRNAWDAIRPRLRHFAETGFIVQLECPAAILGEIAPTLSPEVGPVIFDHLARPDMEEGTVSKSFAAVVGLAERGAIIKVSGGFRVSRQPYPHADLDPIIAAYRRYVPASQFVWGSDWPFLAMAERPGYRSTLDLLERWFPEPLDRHQILAGNPARLFGFAP